MLNLTSAPPPSDFEQEFQKLTSALFHDIREPIRGIQTQALLLERHMDGSADEESCKRLRRIAELAQRLDQLTAQARHYSQIQASTFEYKTINMSSIVQQVWAELTADSALQSEIIVDHSLPNCQGDENRIREVLFHLMSNGLTFNDSTPRILTISHYYGSRDDNHSHMHTYCVQDNGIGIPSHLQDQALMLFKRLHRQGIYGNGIGCGLAIAQKIIQCHGGQLWVESTQNQGSRLFFTLSHNLTEQSLE